MILGDRIGQPASAVSLTVPGWGGFTKGSS